MEIVWEKRQWNKNLYELCFDLFYDAPEYLIWRGQWKLQCNILKWFLPLQIESWMMVVAATAPMLHQHIVWIKMFSETFLLFCWSGAEWSAAHWDLSPWVCLSEELRTNSFKKIQYVLILFSVFNIQYFAWFRENASFIVTLISTNYFMSIKSVNYQLHKNRGMEFSHLRGLSVH